MEVDSLVACINAALRLLGLRLHESADGAMRTDDYQMTATAERFKQRAVWLFDTCESVL